MTQNSPSRRPLASRGTGWAQGAARRLTAADVTPNQISQASMVCAALAGGAFWLAPHLGGAGIGALLVAALFIQLRLICNLLDGMVAIEGGRSAPDGAFWNEAPDRLSDLLILTGAGLATGQLALGLGASALAIATAYMRELGRAEGQAPDFSGPMAKPQRMAALTLGAVLGAGELALWGSQHALTLILWIVALGTALTVLRRAARMVRQLKS